MIHFRTNDCIKNQKWNKVNFSNISKVDQSFSMHIKHVKRSPSHTLLDQSLYPWVENFVRETTEKALDGMKLLKSELEGKKEMCKTKMSQLETSQKRIIELQQELEESQNDAKISSDTKENLERKLVNAQVRFQIDALS